MGVVAGLAGAAAAASLGSSISGMVGGGSSGGQGGYYSGSGTPSVYMGAYQPSMDLNWNDTIQSMRTMPNYPAVNYPQYQQQADAIINNPYAGQYQQFANQASQYGANTLAPMQQQGATSLQGLANQAVPYGNQILQSGFDPQQALYNRTQQQVSDQSNAINAMYGLSSSPYGAGVADKALGDFNINWQNQQLGRQTQAAQGYGNLVSDIGRGYSGASGLGTQGMGTLSQAGALPYQTANAIPQANMSALDSLTQAGLNTFQIPQQMLNNYNSYIGRAQVGEQLGIQAGGQRFNQNQQLGQQFGQALSGLGGAGQSLGSLFGSSPYSTPGYGGGVSAGGGYNPSYPDYGYGQVYDMGGSAPNLFQGGGGADLVAL